MTQTVDIVEVNIIEQNRKELLQLIKIAEDVIQSDVFAEEPEELQDKFEQVYIELQQLVLSENMDKDTFKQSISSIRKTLQEVAVDFANRSNIDIEIKENGAIEIKQ
jgi:hypothetical protein